MASSELLPTCWAALLVTALSLAVLRPELSVGTPSEGLVARLLALVLDACVGVSPGIGSLVLLELALPARPGAVLPPCGWSPSDTCCSTGPEDCEKPDLGRLES